MNQPLPAGLFAYDGSTYLPTEFTRGPWTPDAQHGGPPSALLSHLCQPQVRDDEFITQLDVELVRPVPLTALVPAVERHQVSRRVARIAASLSSEGTVVAHASALVLRSSDLDEPGWEAASLPARHPPSNDAAVDPPRWASGDVTSFHRNAVEHRFTEGAFDVPGPAVDWVRLRLPVVDGAAVKGLERVAAAADFGSGISAVYPPDASTGLINANVVISLHREHVGEWVSLDSTTSVGQQGTGICVTHLGDVEGSVGVAVQTLLGYRVRT